MSIKSTHILSIILILFALKANSQINVSNDTICGSTNIPQVISVTSNDSTSGNLIISSDITNLTILTPPIFGSVNVNPSNYDITYTPTSTTNRHGLDQFVYEIENASGIKDSGIVFLNFNQLDLPLSPIDTVCTPTVNFVADSLSSIGYWDYNPLEITISNSTKANSNATLIASNTSITWKDTQFGCPDIDIELTQDTLKVTTTSGSIQVSPSSEFINLNDIYNFSVSPLSTQSWFVNGTLLDKDTLKPSDFTVGTFPLKFDVSQGALCNASFEDSVTINSLDAGFSLADTLCSSSDIIDLNTTVFDNNSSPSFISNWYINSAPFDGMLSLNTAGTFNISHVVKYNGFTDSIISQVVILAPPSSEFQFKDIDGNNSFCTTAKTIQVNDIPANTPNGIWAIESANTIVQDSITQVEFSTLPPGLYKINHTVSNGCTETEKISFFLAEGLDPSFDNFTNKCESDPILDLENTLNPTTNSPNAAWFLDGSFIPITTLNFSQLSIGEHSLDHISKTFFCSDTATHIFKVDSIKTSSFSGLGLQYCNTESALDLNTLTRFNSGDWFINNSLLTQIQFDTFPLNTSQDLKHVVTNGACIDSTIQSFNVTSEQDPNFTGLSSLYCDSDTIFTNTLTTINSGGTWTINNNPTPIINIALNTLPLGSNTITYSLSGGTCSSDSTLSFNVLEKAIATIPASFNTNYCESDDTIQFSPRSTDSLWYINGIIDTSFIPNKYRSTGTAFIQFTVGSGICSDTAALTVSIDSIIDATFTGLPLENCATDNSISFASLTTIPRTWKLNNTPIFGSIDFTSLSQGQHVLTHEITNGQCFDSDSIEFNLSTPQSSDFTILPNYCEDKDSIVLNNELSPTTPGGKWFLNTDTDSSTIILFSTEAKDIIHSLKYEVISGSCTQSTSKSFTINSIPDTTFTGLQNLYCTSEEIITTQLTPINNTGTWYNNGITIPNDTITLTTSTGNTLRYEVINEACTFSSTQTYDVLSAPDASFTLPTSQYCEDQDSINLETISNLGKWYLNDFTNPINYLTFSTDIAGANQLFQVITSSTCADTASMTFNVDTITPAIWDMDTLFCTEDLSIDLETTYPLANDNWTIESVIGSNLDFGLLTPGTYKIKRSTINGQCTDLDSLSIDLDQTPNITVDSYGPICKHIGSKDLSLKLSSTTYPVRWFINSNELTSTNFTPSDYETGDTLKYEITNKHCSQTGFETLSITEAITKESVELLSMDFTEKIPYNSTTSIYFDLSSGSTVQQVPDSLLITVTDFIPARVLVVELNNDICLSETDYVIFFESELDISAGPDSTFGFEISSFHLQGTISSIGSGKWTYDSPDGAEVWFQNDTLGTTRVNILSPGTVNFIWTVSTPSGQVTSDTAVVKLLNLKIPEGFSPNGDNINDFFEIVGIGKDSNILLTIINRWGQVVYESSNYQGNWDGTDMNSGEKLPNDSYIYRIRIPGIKTKSGTIIIKE